MANEHGREASQGRPGFTKAGWAPPRPPPPGTVPSERTTRPPPTPREVQSPDAPPPPWGDQDLETGTKGPEPGGGGRPSATSQTRLFHYNSIVTGGLCTVGEGASPHNGSPASASCSTPLYTPPPHNSAKRSPQRFSGRIRRTGCSAKQAPSDLDLGPRPQTHLPFACFAVGVMWKPKISLNFREKIYTRLVWTWSVSSNVSVTVITQVVCALCLHVNSAGSNPTVHIFITCVGVVKLMGNLFFHAQTKPAQPHIPLPLWPKMWLHQTQLRRTCSPESTDWVADDEAPEQTGACRVNTQVENCTLTSIRVPT